MMWKERSSTSEGRVWLLRPSQERRMRREMEEHNDLVFLPVTEGYRMNSRKASRRVEDPDDCSENSFIVEIWEYGWE